MPGVDFNVLRKEITMEQVLERLDFQPTGQTAEQLYGACPIHGSSSVQTRQFSVNLNIGRYYCHKCHSKGNPIELWAAVKDLPVYDAAVDLCHALGRNVPWLRRW
jgi:DNA primase